MRKSGATGDTAATSDAGTDGTSVGASDGGASSESSRATRAGAEHGEEVEMGKTRPHKENIGNNIKGPASKAAIMKNTSGSVRRRSSVPSAGTTKKRSAVAETKVPPMAKKSNVAALGKANKSSKRATAATSVGTGIRAANRHKNTRSTTRGASREPHATHPPLPLVGATQSSATSAFDFDVCDDDDERDTGASIAQTASAASVDGRKEGTDKPPAVAGVRRVVGSEVASSTPAPLLADPTGPSPSSVFDFPLIGDDLDSNADASTTVAPGGHKEETEKPPTVAARCPKKSESPAVAAPAAAGSGATASANFSAKSTPTRNRRSPRKPTRGQLARKSSKEQSATVTAFQGETESGKKDRQRTTTGMKRRKRGTATNRNGDGDSDDDEEREEHEHEDDKGDDRAGGGSSGKYRDVGGNDLLKPQAAGEDQHEAVSPRSRLSAWLSRSKGYFESSDEEDETRRRSQTACWLLEEDCSSNLGADETVGEVGGARGGAHQGTKGNRKRPLSGDAGGDTKRSGGRAGAAAASRREKTAGGTPAGRTKKRRRRATIGGAGICDADTLSRKADGGMATLGKESGLALPAGAVSSPVSRRKSVPLGVKGENVVRQRGGGSGGKSGGDGDRADYEKQLQALRAMYTKVDSHQLTVTR